MGKKVLIAYSDEPTRRIISQTLGFLGGHETYVAQGIKEGLNAYKENNFDVVVAGKMYDGNGFKFAAEIRRHDAGTEKKPVIIVVCDDYKDTENNEKWMSINKIFVRPIHSETLLNEVNSIGE
ncbi:hypothetical protein HYZ41_01830 [archaeon]|nr:hypothetical protein [archaeon]